MRTERTTRRVMRTLSDGLLPALRPGAGEPPVAYVDARLPEAEAGPAFTVERREPRRAPDLRADVLVPFWQTLITGLVTLVVAGLLALALGWSWRVPCVAAALALGWAWAARLRLVDALLWRIETATGRDMNRDGRIGKPAGAPVLVNPAVARAGVARAQRSATSERRRHDLLTFAARCYTLGCSEQAHGVRASGPDRRAFVQQRDALLALGLARWKVAGRPNAGWTMCVDRETAARVIGEHTV